MTVAEAAKELGLGKSFVYDLCSLHAPRLRHLRFGGKITITHEAVQEYRESCEVCPSMAQETAKSLERARRVRGLVIPDEIGRIEKERLAKRRRSS